MNALMFIILPHSPIQNQKIIHMLVFFPTLKPPSTFSLPLLTMSSQLSRFGCPLYFWGNLYKSEHQMIPITDVSSISSFVNSCDS